MVAFPPLNRVMHPGNLSIGVFGQSVRVRGSSSIDLNSKNISHSELVKGPFVHGKVANAREVFASVKARNEFRKEYLDFLNEAASGTSTGHIDAIISPVGGHVAAPHDKSGHISYTASRFVSWFCARIVILTPT